MTASAVEKLLSCSSSWLEVADELVKVCGESEVGKAMFGWAWQGVRGEKITNVITEASAGLEKGKITEASFTDYRLKCWNGIKAVDNDLDSFHNLRTISVDCRGVQVRTLSCKVKLLCFPAACVACGVAVTTNVLVSPSCVLHGMLNTIL